MLVLMASRLAKESMALVHDRKASISTISRIAGTDLSYSGLIGNLLDVAVRN